jgi:DNA gyrase/topoisomerase IV subunit A
MYQCRIGNLIEFKWRDKGERIQRFIKGIDLDKEFIVNAFVISDFSFAKDIILITSKGLIKKTELSKFVTNYSKLQGIKLKKEEELVSAEIVNKDREERFIDITTAKGLNFIAEEPKVEPVDRAIIGKPIINLTDGDSIISCNYIDEFNYKEFYVTVNKKGILKTSNRKSGEEIITTSNSSSELFFFTSNGDLFKIAAVMIQNLDKKGIELEKLFENYNYKNPIITIVSVDNRLEFKENFYFFTEKGVVKKTQVKEFIGDYIYNSGYKFKTPGDKLVKVELEAQQGEGLIFTKKGMCLKFDLNSISVMGKNASGVMGISLKDDDKVIFVKVRSGATSNRNNELCVDLFEENLKITTNKGEDKIVDLGALPIQNRAGRGKNVIVFMDDDFIEKVEIIK